MGKGSKSEYHCGGDGEKAGIDFMLNSVLKSTEKFVKTSAASFMCSTSLKTVTAAPPQDSNRSKLGLGWVDGTRALLDSEVQALSAARPTWNSSGGP